MNLYRRTFSAVNHMTVKSRWSFARSLSMVSWQGLSPPQRPLGIVARTGERETESERGTMGRGKREERPHFRFSLFPSFLAGFLFFDYCYFYQDTQRDPLQRRVWSGSAFCIVLAWVKKVNFIRMMLLFVPFPRRLCLTTFGSVYL